MTAAASRTHLRSVFCVPCCGLMCRKYARDAGRQGHNKWSHELLKEDREE